MRRLMLLSTACLLACGTFGGAALAKSRSDDSPCRLKDYSNLVGQDMGEARNAGPNYRLLPIGANPGPVQPARLTIFYDEHSDRIVSVTCG